MIKETLLSLLFSVSIPDTKSTVDNGIYNITETAEEVLVKVPVNVYSPEEYEELRVNHIWIKPHGEGTNEVKVGINWFGWIYEAESNQLFCAVEFFTVDDDVDQEARKIEFLCKAGDTMHSTLLLFVDNDSPKI